MTQSNVTSRAKFILLGFSDLPLQLQYLLFAVFLLIYLITLLANITIIGIITVAPALHTPMYYFLKNLSLVEVAFSTVSIPKLLSVSLTEDKSISFLSCAVQMYLFLVLGVAECFFVSLMALDRYVAICNPLHYMTIMSKAKCVQLAFTSWMIGFVFSTVHTSYIFSLPFCKSHDIYHIVCDMLPLLRLSCSDTFVIEILTLVAGAAFLVIPLLLILISYVFIITNIAKMNSTKIRHKAVSTCASHITSVTLFFGTSILAYMQPKSNYSLGRDRVFAVFYAFVTPMLNPLIYSLRNKEVKEALRKQITSCTLSKAK